MVMTHLRLWPAPDQQLTRESPGLALPTPGAPPHHDQLRDVQQSEFADAPATRVSAFTSHHFDEGEY